MGFLTQTRLPSSWHQQAATDAEIRRLQWQLAIALLVSMCLFDCVQSVLNFCLVPSFSHMFTIKFTIHFPTFPTFGKFTNISHMFTIKFPVHLSHVVSLLPETGAPAPVSGSWPAPAANPRGWPTGTNDSPPSNGKPGDTRDFTRKTMEKHGIFENTWVMGMNFLSIVSLPKNHW